MQRANRHRFLDEMERNPAAKGRLQIDTERPRKNATVSSPNAPGQVILLFPLLTHVALSSIVKVPIYSKTHVVAFSKFTKIWLSLLHHKKEELAKRPLQFPSPLVLPAKAKEHSLSTLIARPTPPKSYFPIIRKSMQRTRFTPP